MAARGVAGDGVRVAGRGVALCFAGWYAQGREAPASKFGKFEATWPSRSPSPNGPATGVRVRPVLRGRDQGSQKGSRALQDASVECCASPRSPSICSPSPSSPAGSRQVCGVCDQAAGACGANPTAEPAPGAAAGSQGPCTRRQLTMVSGSPRPAPRSVRTMAAAAAGGAPRVGKLAPEETALLVCDVQERFRPVITGFPAVVDTSRRMVRGLGGRGTRRASAFAFARGPDTGRRPTLCCLGPPPRSRPRRAAAARGGGAAAAGGGDGAVPQGAGQHGGGAAAAHPGGLAGCAPPRRAAHSLTQPLGCAGPPLPPLPPLPRGALLRRSAACR